MDKEWQEVRRFQESFGHPVSDTPVQMDSERAKKRYGWMLEEINEFLEADEIVEQADAMIDLIYFALGTLVEMGIRPDGLFEIVQRANMSKLWPDGKPRCNEEGKTIKPPGWVDPHEASAREIERQRSVNIGKDR